MIQHIDIKMQIEGRELAVYLIGSDEEGRECILSQCKIPASSIAVAARFKRGKCSASHAVDQR